MSGRAFTASDFEYELPDEQIARYPVDRRDHSRLLTMSRTSDVVEHRVFRDLPQLTAPGDVVVVNESRVLPARLVGRKPTGARAEILLLRPLPEADAKGDVWEALVRPGGKLKPGRCVEIAPDLTVHVLDSTPGSGRIVRLETPLTIDEALSRHGRVPLPPYLGREDEPADRERYQTVYARVGGSVAAPTAGLHFTPELMTRLESAGVTIARLTLHVGVGTFRPVDVEDLTDHHLHEEVFEIPEDAADAINAARGRGGRIWAIGTTVVRTLEGAAREHGALEPGAGSTRLFIHPPYDFQVVDALITNFHLPRSSLLMLVSAFAGYERTMAAYREAVGHGYRFYSYGDAMVVT